MSKVIVYCNNNYADEFDLSGWEIIDLDKFVIMKEKLETFFDKRKREVKVYFGTNEAVYLTSLNDCYSEFKLITDEEAKTIRKFFGFSDGMISFSQCYNRIFDDYDDEEDDL